MQEFLTQSRDKIAELCRTHHVRGLAVFGSAVRDDFDPSRSDVDLLVEFKPDGIPNRFQLYFDLHEALEGILRKKVDLMESGSSRNPYRQRAVERDQQTIYAA